MKKYKVLAWVFMILALILSYTMVGMVAWNYCDMVWGIRYLGYSAGAEVALLYAVPFGVGIVGCLGAWVQHGGAERCRENLG